MLFFSESSGEDVVNARGFYSFLPCLIYPKPACNLRERKAMFSCKLRLKPKGIPFSIYNHALRAP
jgi:hypothetical protein